MIRWTLLLLMAVLVGCSSSSSKKPSSRYSVDQDYGPDSPVDVSHVENAVPKVEPRSRGGNKSPYEVLGRTYHVLGSADGYRQRGGASWYGNKFHGHATSNGETYDMFKMTAAHKTLPIPTYARVTNLANDRQVIVRINDRGPFHRGRIIDLSYAAASKLGMLAKGTAQVEVEAINPRTWQSSQTLRQLAGAGALAPGQYVQAGVYSSQVAAQRVRSRLQGELGQPVHTLQVQRDGRTLYKVLLGPANSVAAVNEWVMQLETRGFTGAHSVDLPL